MLPSGYVYAWKRSGYTSNIACTCMCNNIAPLKQKYSTSAIDWQHWLRQNWRGALACKPCGHDTDSFQHMMLLSTEEHHRSHPTRCLTSLTRVDTVLSAPQKPFCMAITTICGQYPRVVTSTGTCRWDARSYGALSESHTHQLTSPPSNMHLRRLSTVDVHSSACTRSTTRACSVAEPSPPSQR